MHEINADMWNVDTKNTIFKDGNTNTNTNTYMWVGGIQMRMLHATQLPLTELCSQIVQETIPMWNELP